MGMASGFIQCGDGSIASSSGEFNFQKNSSGSFSFTFPTNNLTAFVATPTDAYEASTVIVHSYDGSSVGVYTGYGDGYKDIGGFSFIAVWS